MLFRSYIYMTDAECVKKIIDSIKDQSESGISVCASRMTLPPIDFESIASKNNIDKRGGIFVNSGLDRQDFSNNVPVFRAIVNTIKCSGVNDIDLKNMHTDILNVLCAQNKSEHMDMGKPQSPNKQNGCLWQQYQLLAEDIMDWTDRDYVACPILLKQTKPGTRVAGQKWDAARCLHLDTGGELSFPIINVDLDAIWEKILNNANREMVCMFDSTPEGSGLATGDSPSPITSSSNAHVDIPIFRSTFRDPNSSVPIKGKTHFDSAENTVKRNFIQRWEFDFSNIVNTGFTYNNWWSKKGDGVVQQRTVLLPKKQKNVLVMGQGEIIQMNVRGRTVWWDNVNLDNGDRKSVV